MGHVYFTPLGLSPFFCKFSLHFEHSFASSGFGALQFGHLSLNIKSTCVPQPGHLSIEVSRSPPHLGHFAFMLGRPPSLPKKLSKKSKNPMQIISSFSFLLSLPQVPPSLERQPLPLLFFWQNKKMPQ